MKAAIINRFGKPEELRIDEVDKPEAGDEQVVIKVMAAGVNPVDAKIRAGTHRSVKELTLPVTLGKEVSGTVVTTGKRVTDFRPGDAVFGFLPSNGGFAEYAAADAQLVVKKPENISFEEAGCVSLAGLTACQAIHEHLQLSAGQKILIQAAAGGVGHLAVQLAKMAGADVSGTASGKNEQFLKTLGADQVIDYKKERFEEKVRDLDAVLDAMGGEVLYRSIACVKPGGRVVCLPSSTKNDPKAMALARERGVRLIWPMMHPERSLLQLLADLLEQGKLKVEIGKVFPLEEIMQAHKAIESHGSKGKIVMRIG